MIYTVTFNPSLDYIIDVTDFEIGKTNRTSSEQILPGGKGINVSTVLSNLGIESTALGFIAGYTGTEIERLLGGLNVSHRFIKLKDGASRINVKLKNYDGTEINGMGPDIDEGALAELMSILDDMKEGDTLVLAGSIPKSLPDSIYHDIMERYKSKGVRFVVDAEKDLLLNVLEFHPFLIKPNNHELGAIFGTELTTRESVVPYARKLQEKGAVNVLVSMASKGAVLLDENGDVHMIAAAEGKLINAVGAGDSMVAGFIAGWEERHDYSYALRMGSAAGGASAQSENLATGQEIRNILEKIKEL